MEDEDGGLFNIEVSSADESANENAKVPRDFQSEEDFQRQRVAWRPKVETGEVLLPHSQFGWKLTCYCEALENTQIPN